MQVDHTNFSTMSVPAHERAAHWDIFFRENIAQFRLLPLGSADIYAEVHRVAFPEFTILSLACMGSLMERLPDLIDANRANSVMVTVILSGKSFIYHSTGIDVMVRGDVSLYDLDVPCSYGTSDDFLEVAISLPREGFMARYGDQIPPEPTVIRAPLRHDFAIRTEHLIELALLARSEDPSSTSIVVDGVFQLLDELLGRPSSTATRHWLIAHEHIRSSFHDSRLSRYEIAAAVGVSERQLSRVFAARGTTVAQAITDERMRQAHDMLGDPLQNSRTIFEIAQAVGYQSPSHFARTFRRMFGASALSYRATQNAPDG